MSKLKQSLKHKKDGNFEFVYLYNVPVYYASVHEPRKKYKSDDREYQLTAFVTKEVRDQLENEVLINKQLAEVGVDRNKKRQIKYDLEKYGDVKGLHGISITRPEFSKGGKPQAVTVVDAKGKPFDQDIGNLSVVTLKLFGYRNQDELLNVSLDTVLVIDHVPYEGGSGEVVDDDLGITYQPKRVETKQQSKSDTHGDEDEPPFEADDFADEDF